MRSTNSAEYATRAQLATAPAANAFPQLPGIDTDDGLRRATGKASSYEKLLRIFHDRHAGSPDTVRQHLAAGRQDDARREAHSSKGVSASVGAEASQAALALELALRAGRADVDGEIAAFETALGEVIGGLRRHFGWPDPLQ